jgi:hypothetical protein
MGEIDALRLMIYDFPIVSSKPGTCRKAGRAGKGTEEFMARVDDVRAGWRGIFLIHKSLIVNRK